MKTTNVVLLQDTILLGSFLDEDVKYFFYEAKTTDQASDSEISDCLKLRYQKYGDVIFQRKLSEDSRILFTLMEAVPSSLLEVN
jgi:hypothetical protein